MKTQKNTIMIFVVSLFFSLACHAQDFISGTISDYSIGEGLLFSYDMVSRENIEIGKIDDEGHFKIPLDKDYLTTIKEQAEKAKEKAPKGWEINFKTVATTFECFGGDLEYQNGEVLLAGIPDPEVTDKNQESERSVMYAVSHPEIADWLFSYGQKNIVKGYYLQWFFVEDVASAKGECIVQRHTGNDEENYNDVTITNLELKKGWNIIKYTIAEVYTDSNGNRLPSRTEITNISELPEDLQWVKVVLQ